MKPLFFKTPADWRAWLERHHSSEAELWVGFHRKGSGRPSITWPESVDGALCFGWIDGIRKSLDDQSYVIRFTPRRTGSIWSAVNIKRAQELKKVGLMSAAGLSAFERRRADRSAIYAYEQRRAARLSAAHEKLFRAEGAAWKFFSAQAPGYRNTATYWVVSAKKPETQLKRLQQLIDDCSKGQKLQGLVRPQPGRSAPR